MHFRVAMEISAACDLVIVPINVNEHAPDKHFPKIWQATAIIFISGWTREANNSNVYVFVGILITPEPR